jgi:hypothetical protein
VLNPLTTLAALGIAGWFLAWLVGSLVGRNRFVPSDGRRRFLRQLWPWVALGGVTLNWAWLLFMASSPS